MTDPTGSDADEATPSPPAEPDGPPPALPTDDDGPTADERPTDDDATDEGGEDEEDEDEEDEEDEEEAPPPASRRLRQVAAILAVISGFMLGGGLFLPYAASAGVENPGLTIDFSQPSWVISMSNFGLPALMVLAGLAVLGEFMRPSVGAGVVLTASISRLLTAAAGLAFLLMVGSQAQLSLASGFYVLGSGGILGLLAGAILLATSRRSPG
jgi:hypothetical protein